MAIKDTLKNRQNELTLAAIALRKANVALEKAKTQKAACDERYEEARVLFRQEVESVNEETKVSRT